jgi:hypothetical protein
VASFLEWRGWPLIGGVLGGAGALAGICAAYLAYVTLHLPAPNPPPPVIVNSAETTGLSIVEAELKTKIHKRPFLLFFMLGSDNFYLVDVLIKNTERIARQHCYVLLEYAGPTVKGRAVLFSGLWPEWYQKGASLNFDLPDDPAFSHEFFAIDPIEMRRLDNARVRVVCQQPNVQISPWHNVDLSRADWN